MNYEKFDVIEFDKENYIVLNVINYNSFTYLYLINESEENDDISIVKVEMRDNEPNYVHVKDDDEFNIVLNMIMEENKSISDELIEN